MCIFNNTIKNPHTGQYILVPCRQCPECKQMRAREWSLRCMLETQKYEQNCFLTLTYENNPVKLIKKDLQDFIKRLRKHIEPKKIKYFACGEYGSKRWRPHFHIIIFNHDFTDKWKTNNSNSNKEMYHSDTLDRIWGKGITTIQDVTINSCGYCALYSSTPRKYLPPLLQETPEFNLMSQGLGLDTIIQNIDKYAETDEIFLDGQSYKIPNIALKKKYCYNQESGIYDNKYIKLKEKRLQKARENSERYQKNLYDTPYYYEMPGTYLMEQKQIIAESRKKHLTRPLD